ncbi:unnamed protein product [Owenia fusiformis]|uniref:Uncharacterized protein n=1 Tax=Owenia fusiformis TaxID=6347 RepID=A0A8S4MXN0_OWEFU|nr:unnamed protein product [Owenia fusiformis]
MKLSVIGLFICVLVCIASVVESSPYRSGGGLMGGFKFTPNGNMRFKFMNKRNKNKKSGIWNPFIRRFVFKARTMSLSTNVLVLCLVICLAIVVESAPLRSSALSGMINFTKDGKIKFKFKDKKNKRKKFLAWDPVNRAFVKIKNPFVLEGTTPPPQTTTKKQKKRKQKKKRQ